MARANSVREIRTKASTSLEDIRKAYAGAADGQNARLDQVCKGLEESAPASDVAPAARTPASTLVDWVAIRNRALAVPVMTNDAAEAVRASIARDLTEIANTSWKSARGDDPQKRTKKATALRERLRWRSWEDLQWATSRYFG